MNKNQKKPLNLIIDAIDNKKQLSVDELIIVLYSYFNHRGFFYTKNTENIIKSYPTKDFYKFKQDIFGKYKALDFQLINNESENTEDCDSDKNDIDYSNVNISNDDWCKEINLFINSQSFFKNDILTKFQDDYLKLFRYIRNYSKGPGSDTSGSKYGLYEDKEDVDGNIKVIKRNENVNNLWEFNIKKCKVYENLYTELLKSPFFQVANWLGNIINIQFLNKNNELEKINSEELKKFIDYINNFICKHLEKTKSISNKYDLNPKDYLEFFEKTRNLENSSLSFDNLGSIRGYKTTNSTKNKNFKKEIDDVKFPALNNLIFASNFLYKHKKLKLEEFNLSNEVLLKRINSLFCKFNLFIEYQQDEAFSKFKEYLEKDWNFSNDELDRNEILKVFDKIKDDLNNRCNFSLKAIDEYLKYIFSFNPRNELKNIDSFFSKQVRDNERNWLKRNTNNTIYIPKNIFENEIISPNSKRTLLQSIKVINSLIKELRKKYKNDFELSNIVIETAREENDEYQKEKITNDMKKNNEFKNIVNKLTESIKDNSKNPSTGNLKEKVYLWLQQDKRDIYEPKVHINEDDLVTSKCQIDHIIPISISGIDSLDNKVLTFSTKNRNKDNNIPKDFLLGKDWEDFKKNVQQLNISRRKKEYLLIQDDKWKENFLSKSLNDTRTSTSILKKYLVLFKEINDGNISSIWNKTNISSINGIFTNLLRKKIFSNSKEKEIIKDRSINNHHAIDACLVCYFGTNSEILKLEEWKKRWWDKKHYQLDNTKFNIRDFTYKTVISKINENNKFIIFLKQINNNEENIFNKYVQFSTPILKKTNKQLFDDTLLKIYNSKLSNNDKKYIVNSIELTNKLKKEDLEKYLRKPNEIKVIEEDIEKYLPKDLSDYIKNKYPLMMWKNNNISWEYKELSKIYYSNEFKEDAENGKDSNPFINYIKKSNYYNLKNLSSNFNNLSIPLFKNSDTSKKPTLIKKLRILDTIQIYFKNENINNFKIKNKTFHKGLNKFYWNVYKINDEKPFLLNIDKRYIKISNNNELIPDTQKISRILDEKKVLSKEPVISIYDGMQFALKKIFYNKNNVIKEEYWWIKFFKHIGQFDNDYIRFKSIGSVDEPSSNPRVELKCLNFSNFSDYFKQNPNILKNLGIENPKKFQIRPYMQFILKYFDLIEVDSIGNIKKRIDLSKLFKNFN